MSFGEQILLERFVKKDFLASVVCFVIHQEFVVFNLTTCFFRMRTSSFVMYGNQRWEEMFFVGMHFFMLP